MLLAISSPEILAKDTFSKMDSSNIIQTTNFGVDSGSESVYDFSPELNLEKEASKVYSSERVQKKVFKLETRQNKYREKLREKESEYKYYNNILRAINGDKKAKKEVLKNEMLQEFSKRKEEINVNVNVNQKNPLIKEYLKLYNEAEKKPYTKIGRMAQNMRAIAAQQEVLKKAAELCEDENEKKALLSQCEKLNKNIL